mgnify:CR=1 FL=1
MRLKIILYSFSVFACFGCTKVQVSEQLPDTRSLSPLNINTDLPVVNIDLPQDSFNRMYENYLTDIRYKAFFTYYPKAGAAPLLSTLACVINLRGRTSAVYELKSLGIEFESPVDNEHYEIIDPPIILNGDDLSSLANLRLRNSGNDFKLTMLKDLVYTQFMMAVGLDLEVRYGTPVQAFVNGRYYGLLNLRTENNRLALSHLLQADTLAISTLKLDVDNGNLETEEGNPIWGDKLRQALREKNTEAITALIDVDNFLDYIIFEDYIGNNDWPDNNVSAYTINGSALRFFVFDLDFAAFRTKNALLPEMEFRDDDVSKIYQLLIQDSSIANRLKKRQEELYRRFSPRLFNSLLGEASASIENDILYNISKYGQPSSSLEWYLNLEDLKRNFERRDYYMRKKYNID